MPNAIAEIRSFNRSYTKWVGALDRHHLGSDYSLVEVRVLYEIAHRPNILARNIADQLGLDAGYLSRILTRFDKAGLIDRNTSDKDGRAVTLSLTARGQTLFRDLDRLAADRVSNAIVGLDEGQRARLTSAMGVIGQLIGEPGSAKNDGVRLRQPRAGDFGWAVERHGVIYDAEFGWGPAFEGLVAELFGKFAQSHNPSRERCWIAELNGERVGVVFVVEREPEVAQLRCLLVEPKARGHGVGGKLVDACVEFARDAGYRRMMLWTNKGLDSARKIYEAVGFELVEEKPHRDFGPELIGQSWEMTL
jgi:DNA-binding MarR family transcriptional regulator/N-acetylglutamate synthase-like GNAT family acetyltransferase